MDSSKSITFFRGGYVVSLDAWKRYFANGHDLHLHTSNDQNEDGDKDEKVGSAPTSKEERQLKEERRLEEEMDVTFNFTSDVRRAFRILYRKAPQEVRVRLVLPHDVTRIVKLPQGGNFYEWKVFIPTSWGSPSTRRQGPCDVDQKCIQTFIEGANSLINDDARRTAGGFQLSDFQFERLSDWAVGRPVLSEKELKDLANSGAEAFQLWGLSPREFLSPYM